ncbi:hypothetical protein [Photorhabdus asymbiotica]|uniref:hypothetical protein n=1 Tax=Photorhabdus asymbiotica TaxID=291112 RepID=UPI003DA75549
MWIIVFRASESKRVMETFTHLNTLSESDKTAVKKSCFLYCGEVLKSGKKREHIMKKQVRTLINTEIGRENVRKNGFSRTALI